MKTPEEIKKGLECCYSPVEPKLRCEACPYYGSIVCKMRLHTDALALIQRLEADNAKKDETIQMLQDGNASLMNMIDEACEKTVRLERERDALTNDLYSIVNDHVTPCFCCKTFDPSTTVCEHEGDVDCFTWRGVPEKEEEHEADSD